MVYDHGSLMAAILGGYGREDIASAMSQPPRYDCFDLVGTVCMARINSAVNFCSHDIIPLFCGIDLEQLRNRRRKQQYRVTKHKFTNNLAGT